MNREEMMLEKLEDRLKALNLTLKLKDISTNIAIFTVLRKWHTLREIKALKSNLKK